MSHAREFEELTVTAARVQEGLRVVRGRAASDGGEVSIEVGVDGRITGVVLSPSFSFLDARVGAELIARTHSAALSAASLAAADIRRELLDDPRVGQLVERTLNRRGGSPDQDGSEGGAPRRVEISRAESEYVPDDPAEPSSIYDRWK